MNRELTEQAAKDPPRIASPSGQPLQVQKASRAPGLLIGSMFVGVVLALEICAFHAAYPSILPHIPVPSPTPTPAPSPPPKAPIDPIDGLTKLGWTVKPTPLLSFEVMFSPMPDMKESAQYMMALKSPFGIFIQGAPSLTGLSQLSGNVNLRELAVDYGTYQNIAEIGRLTSLSKLEISQVPVNNISMLSHLKSLRELVITNDPVLSNIRPLSSLSGLKRLILNHTSVSDLTPLTHLPSLSELDVGDTDVLDISPLVAMKSLSDLRIGGRSIPSLQQLSGAHVTHLHIFGAFIPTPSNISLSGVNGLSDLRELDIMTSYDIDLAPLKTSCLLSDFKVIGIATAIGLRDAAALSGCKDLVSLTVAGSTLSDISFVSSLELLENVDISGTRAFDISPLLNLKRLKKLTVINDSVRSDVLAELERRGVAIRLN